MCDGKTKHFYTNQVILQPIGDIIFIPISNVIDETMTFQIGDAHALPPGKEHNTLDTQKLAQRVPIDWPTQITGGGMIKLDEAIQGPHLTNVDTK